MASSSSSHIKRYDVFSSFHGPDVRQGFLSHLHAHFATKGITTFNDQKIVRGQTIGPELVQAIRESRVSTVVLSKKYASSSWCLDELVEILKCKKDQGQTVIPIFYKVDPSDVKKQRGKFGSTFEETCQGKSEEAKQIWSKALADVAIIAGHHGPNEGATEAYMIQKIATDVLKKLNATPSKDFEGMVGHEAHFNKLESLLCFGCDDVKMIGIWGPAGIGKSTIARALYDQLSGSFKLTCFMGNLKGSCKSNVGIDDHGSKLYLQKKLLSKIFNQKDMKVDRLSAIQERLQNQRVLIVLDDVDDLKQLEALAGEVSWFGSGSRIIVTTKDKKILKNHEIHDIYHVNFPSEEEALEILCRSAFKQSSVPDGFEELAKKVVKFCGNLPLGLCVVGSSLRGESKKEWELQLPTIETTVDRKTGNILRVGYDKLPKQDQYLFLHIACLFNNHDVNRVTSLLTDSELDVRNGLKTLAEKSLVRTNGSIVMHYLLQKLGRQIVFEQSGEPGKRQFLVKLKEIRDVLTTETGTGSVIGISLNTSKIGKDDNFSVGKRAFVGMPNLRFLRIYSDWLGGGATLKIPEDMEYLPRLTLLHWDFYPRKSLSPGFQPERLVELRMQESNLEELWGGIGPLPNLKSIDLGGSFKLKEIPNLSEATKLETLRLERCKSLVELPSSIKNLHKLKRLDMQCCRKLRGIPTSINLRSLEEIEMSDCSQLESFPDISTNIMELHLSRTKIEKIPSSITKLRKLKKLVMYNCQKLRVIPTNINLPSLEVFSVNTCSQLASFPDISCNIKQLDLGDTQIKDLPPSVVSYSRLECLEIGSRNLERLTHVPPSVRRLILKNSDIERIPGCVTGLPHLVFLDVENCPKLVSIPALSPSLEHLRANVCISLKRVCCSFPNQTMRLSFYNCIQLDEESRRGIIQQSIQGDILLPGKEIPAEFTHKAIGNSITIPLAPRGDGTFSASSRFKACILLSSVRKIQYEKISCCLRSKGDGTVHSFSRYVWLSDMPSFTEHLFIFRGDLFPQRNRCQEVDVTVSEITIEFSSEASSVKIIECGVEIMTEEAECSSREQATTTTTQMEMERKIMKQKVSDNPIFRIVSRYSVYLQLAKHEFHDLKLTEEAEGSSSSQVDNFEIVSKGITAFNDQKIERGQTIGPELVQGIRESRVSVVVLSEKYASSRWCLDELVEILKCKEASGQIVMPIFYKVDPSDVRKQKEDFGSTFEETCEGKSEEVKQSWRKALTDVANIAGEHSLIWANEAKMIEKIATDVSKKLNITQSKDFEGMVGLEGHLRKLESLLCLESDDVKMIRIWGPAGIGKSTIARALYNQLSSSFQLRCFMENHKDSYKSTLVVDSYESKLSLQSQLLSKILNQRDMRVHHLGAIKEWLHDQRVLIILDDVDDLEQLEVLAKDISWFGSGSRIIITTEDKKILKAHGINHIYHVDFPTEKDALEILCRSAFKQSSVPDGYEEVAKKVVEFCGNLPLGLCVVGSSLHGESKHEWELQLSTIETSIDRKIEGVLRVGYNRLLPKDQSLFLHIACFFNNHDVDHVTSMVADSGLDVRNGLKRLSEKSLVLVHTNGSIVMHYLLQQLGTQIVREQSDEPGKRQFLVEVKEICDVLASGTGTGSVIGISLDTSKIDHNVSVDNRAFEGMRNLQFLRIYKDMSKEIMGFFLENPEIFSGEADDILRIHKGWLSRQPTLQIPEDMEYLSWVRLLHWESYPRKSLPSRFKPNCLIELHMP